MQGVVTAHGTPKTITVQIVRRFRHKKYGKIVQMKRRFHVHDAQDAAHVGDTVEIVECRPVSRTKHWRLERVIQRNPEQAVAAAPPPPAEPLPAP